MHLQKLIPTRFHRLPSGNTRGGSCTYWNPQSFATWMGTRVEVVVKGTCDLKRLEKIGRSDKRRPLCTLLAPCGTDRYLVPLIGRINGAGCGAKGEAGPKCSAGGQREMDGRREKKRRFHLKKGSWIAKGGKGGLKNGEILESFVHSDWQCRCDWYRERFLCG